MTRYYTFSIHSQLMLSETFSHNFIKTSRIATDIFGIKGSVGTKILMFSIENLGIVI